MSRSKPKQIASGVSTHKSPVPVKGTVSIRTNKLWILFSILAGTTVFSLILRYFINKRKSRLSHLQVPTKKLEISGIPEHKKDSFVWDVCVVGAGPAGATCAYHLAKNQYKVLMIDKESFPRDKICGDQVNPQAQYILSDMGILQSLIDENMVKWVCYLVYRITVIILMDRI